MSPDAGTPRRPARRPVEYKGAPLDPERGPGLGCFWVQVVLLVVFVIATPLSVGRVPDVVTAILLFVVIGLLFFVGQTAIFLLRLVAAERREARRRPLASTTKTVGELEAELAGEAGEERGVGSAVGSREGGEATAGEEAASEGHTRPAEGERSGRSASLPDEQSSVRE